MVQTIDGIGELSQRNRLADDGTGPLARVHEGRAAQHLGDGRPGGAKQRTPTLLGHAGSPSVRETVGWSAVGCGHACPQGLPASRSRTPWLSRLAAVSLALAAERLPVRLQYATCRPKPAAVATDPGLGAAMTILLVALVLTAGLTLLGIGLLR